MSRIVDRMTAELTHRGPDDVGSWHDATSTVFLGHRRLEVVGLGPAGHQPMMSRSRRWTVTYNGELYDTTTLRRSLGLKQDDLVGTSDTEILLWALDRWGFEGALDRLEGMFAFAAWDAFERCLHLVRDRFGEKPLYYSVDDGMLLFGSELRSIRAAGSHHFSIEPESIADLLQYGYIPAPRTVYEQVHKLPAGHAMRFNCATGGRTISRYWHPQDDVGQRPAKFVSLDEAADELQDLLVHTVRTRLASDVPVGIFLSGGVDSSLVLATASQVDGSRPRTFTLGFDEASHDESLRARRIAKHFGTDHTEVILTASEALAVVPLLSRIYDEPFADSSQIPFWLLCRETRRQVTVALSGDGGDELFGGYDRYRILHFLDTSTRFIPAPILRLAGSVIDRRSTSAFEGGRTLRSERMVPAGLHLGSSLRVSKLAAVLKAPRTQRLQVLHTLNPDPSILIKGIDPQRRGLYELGQSSRNGTVDEAMLLDFISYLPEDLLTKADRASMSVGLEVRSPLLDRRIIEFCRDLPLAHKMSLRQGKLVPRKLLSRLLPGDLSRQPKKGFGVPLARWLRSDLRTWAGDLLAPASLDASGLFETSMVSAMWDIHQQGVRDLSAQIWPILIFQSWYETWH